MSTKGITLETGTCAVLALDGTLVYVESVSPSAIAVVALPDQPNERSDDRVFTPGRVGAKKISPFAKPERTVAIADLSERNREFIGTYERLREQHGPNHVDRTPEEAAAHAVANAPKVKVDRAAAKAARDEARKQAKAERAARKAAAAMPRYLQRCETCGQQPGHPDHGTGDGKHEFVAPTPKCIACNRPEADDVHAKAVDDGGHTFVLAGGRAPKAPKAPKAPAAPRGPKPAAVPDGQAYRWIGDDAALTTLAAVNPKYKAGNSGASIVDAIRATGDEGASLAEVMSVLSQHERWRTVPQERVAFAFQQLLGAKLIAAV